MLGVGQAIWAAKWEILAPVIAIGSLASVVWAVAMLAFFMVKSRWEDRLLLAEYRAEWQDWARGTGRLVPRIGRVDDGK